MKVSDFVEGKLMEIGATPEYTGYKYLVCAIVMSMQNEYLLNNVTTKGVTGNLAAHHRRRSTPSPSPYNPQPLLPAEKNNTSREMNIPLLSCLGA